MVACLLLAACDPTPSPPAANAPAECPGCRERVVAFHDAEGLQVGAGARRTRTGDEGLARFRLRGVSDRHLRVGLAHTGDEQDVTLALSWYRKDGSIPEDAASRLRCAEPGCLLEIEIPPQGDEHVALLEVRVSPPAPWALIAQRQDRRERGGTVGTPDRRREEDDPALMPPEVVE